MNRESQKYGLWPHPAKTLFASETDLLRLLMSGLRDRYKMPFVIGHGPTKNLQILRPFEPWRLYPAFCKYLQTEIPGGQALCDSSTCSNMNACLLHHHAGKSEVLTFKCTMGLCNFYYPLYMDNHVLGCNAGGKIVEEEADRQMIQQNVERFISALPNVTDDQVLKLMELTDSIPICTKEAVRDRKDMFIQGVSNLSKMISAEYLRNKDLAQRSARHKTEDALSSLNFANNNHTDNEPLNDILADVCKYLGTKYIAFFLSDKAGSGLLELETQFGLKNLTRGDVHFNLRKATLDQSKHSINIWDFDTHKHGIMKGIRGSQRSKLTGLSYLYPFELAGYDGAIVLGPMRRAFDMGAERIFLNVYCNAIGQRIAAMHILKELRKKDKEKDRGILLSAHMFRQGLQHILEQVSEIDFQAKSPQLSKHEIVECVDNTRDYIEELRKRVLSALEEPQAIKAILKDLRDTHLNRESVSPEIIVEDCLVRLCATSNIARSRFTVEDSISDLPAIWVDRDVTKIAFDNLLENAGKYTKKNGLTRISGRVMKAEEMVVITIENTGLEIRDDELARIFESGFRSAAAKKISPNAGHGLGLGQVKQIIEIHGGTITVVNTQEEAGDWGYRTKFSITLPTTVGVLLGISQWKTPS